MKVILFLGKHSQKYRQQRDTFTSIDLLVLSSSNLSIRSGKMTSSSSPIPITYPVSQHFHQSSSQPTTTGCRRLHSPPTDDRNNLSYAETSGRRYSVSAVLPPSINSHPPRVPSTVNLIPTSMLPQNVSKYDDLKTHSYQKWHIPIYLYSCNEARLTGSLLVSNDQQLRDFRSDRYIDYTKEENQSASGITTVVEMLKLKARKRGIT